jgi:hypothetical protein
MDTLYTLCRSVDNRHAPPFTAEQVAQIAAYKKAHFAQAAADNPLVRAILQGATLTYDGIEGDDRRGFLAGPATFFRTHEILRQTARRNTALRIGAEEFPHNVVADLFDRCVPNAKLHHLPWFSPARYTTSLALVWGVTLLISHLVARDRAEGGLFDAYICYHLGLGGTIAALAYTALKRNRDVRRPAPWNSAIYLDANADLVRRDSPLLAAARKDLLPRQTPYKTPEFYYALARRIEAHGLDTDLARHLPAAISKAGQV